MSVPSFVPLPSEPEDEHLMDAARAEFIAHGFRRTSVGDIAQRARVSRPTVYRRLGDKDQIVRKVVQREVVQYFERSGFRFFALPTPEERTVETFADGIVAFQENEVAQAIMRHEPETFAAFASALEAEEFRYILDLLAAGLSDGHASDEAVQRTAEVILRLTVSLLLAPTRLHTVNTADDARRFANAYFVPIIKATLT